MQISRREGGGLASGCTTILGRGSRWRWCEAGSHPAPGTLFNLCDPGRPSFGRLCWRCHCYVLHVSLGVLLYAQSWLWWPDHSHSYPLVMEVSWLWWQGPGIPELHPGCVFCRVPSLGASALAVKATGSMDRDLHLCIPAVTARHLHLGIYLVSRSWWQWTMRLSVIIVCVYMPRLSFIYGNCR